MLVPIALPICNVFLLQGTRPILVDTGRPRDCAAIVAALRYHGIAPADLSLIVHTHSHWDHAGSTSELRKLTRARIAIHAADAPMLRRGDNGMLRPMTLTARMFRPLLDWHYPGTEPNLLIEREMDLSDFGVPARIVLTPGHTAGSITVVTARGDAMIGDLLMGGYLGGWLRPHRPGMHYFAEDVSAVLQSVRKVLELRPARIHPAHGGPLDPAAVERWLRQR
jgi:glyoxylase-like metal-dependent hydrolase (beta-lactamase superfamily II)